MSLRRLFVATLLPLTVSSGPLVTGCNEPAECTAGTERCACYGNGTCEEGLVCLSNHCVDPTPERDAAVTRASGEPSATSTGGGVDLGASQDGGPNSDAPTADEGTHAPEAAMSGPADTATAAANPDATDAPATGETPDSETAPSVTTSRDVSIATTDTSTSNGAASDDTISNDTTSNGATSDDSTSNAAPTIPTLPEQAADAIDDFAPAVAPQMACAAGFDPDDVCYEALACAEDACTATLDWTWATGAGAWADYWFQLRDVSGDGTVALGSWRVDDYSLQHTMLLRWGTSRATLIGGSSPTAINFDASAAIGALEEVNDEWTFVRWSRTQTDRLPDGLGTPYDLSHETTVVGLDRVEGVLRGFVWTTGAPTYASTLGLQKISGDGKYAAGLPDGGPVVLFYANGTKRIPPTSNLRPDAVTDVNTDGTVVVGYGWSQAALRSPMYRWRVAEEEVDVIAPLTGFQSATPFGVSGDGELVVGAHQNGATYGPKGDTEAFYWDEASGTRPMVDEVIARGVSVPSDFWLSTARIASDGTTVIGEGYKGDARILWRARLAR